MTMTMTKNQAIEILYKYKDYLPFDYVKFYNDLLEGNIDALKYMAYLIRHDTAIHRHNDFKPLIRRIRPGEMFDGNLIYTRLNFIVYSESLTYFDGYY